MVIPCSPEFKPFQEQFARGISLIELAQKHDMMNEYAIFTDLFHEKWNSLLKIIPQPPDLLIPLSAYTHCLDLFEEAMNDALPRAKMRDLDMVLISSVKLMFSLKTTPMELDQLLDEIASDDFDE